MYCCRGETTPESLLKLSGQEVREAFPKVRNGILGAIDFMRKQLKIAALKNLPYPGLIIPLSAFFAEPDGKEVSYDSVVYNQLKQWFWKKIKDHHMLHHYNDSSKGYGVSSKIWDTIFHSDFPTKKDASTS